MSFVRKFVEAHCHQKRIQWTLYFNTYWGMVLVTFSIKKFQNFDILSWFLYKIYSRLCLLAYNSVIAAKITKCQHTIMHLHFVNFCAKSQPDSFDTHRVETLCLQHTLARLSLILQNPRLSKLQILPSYITLMKLDRQSFIFKI